MDDSDYYRIDLAAFVIVHLLGIVFFGGVALLCGIADQKATVRTCRMKIDALEHELTRAKELAAMLYGVAVKSTDADAAEVAKTVTQRMGYNIGADSAGRTGGRRP